MLRSISKKIASLPKRIRARNAYFVKDRKALGVPAAAAVYLSPLLPVKLSRLSLAGYSHPLFYRPRTSDVSVIRQIFTYKEYAAVGKLQDIGTIIDCGANIGCASFYLLNRYPQARAIVIEPDEDNMSVCRKNLEPFADRVSFIQAGIWPEATSLKVVRGAFRDGKSWSYQVRPCEAGEAAEFRAVTIPGLIEQCGGKVDLLKVDIEGAELGVFSSPDVTWLGNVRNMAVELHDERCTSAFNKAMGAYRCRRYEYGDMVVCEDIVGH